MESSVVTRPFMEADIATWTDADNERLLDELNPIFNAPQGTPEAARAAALVDLIEAYEEKRYQINAWLAADEHLTIARHAPFLRTGVFIEIDRQTKFEMHAMVVQRELPTKWFPSLVTQNGGITRMFRHRKSASGMSSKLQIMSPCRS